MIGKLWQVIDQGEDCSWLFDAVSRGATVESVRKREQDNQWDITLSLPMEQAVKILGREPDQEEWLEEA